MYKICVYTCITGNYDNLAEINKSVRGTNIDFYCYTNNPNLKSKTWKIMGLNNEELLDDVRLQRKCKILGNPAIEEKYDWIIWMDANVRLRKDIRKYIDEQCIPNSKNYDWFQLKHCDRDCIYDESEACKELKKDDFRIIDKTINIIKKDDFPRHFGLTCTNLFVRKANDKHISKIQQEWWNMVKNYSRRDQLSFMYIIWKNKYKKLYQIDLIWYDNEYFKVISHNDSLDDTLKKLNSDIKMKNEEILLLKKQNEELKISNENILNENDNLHLELSKIINSKSWKYVSILRNMFHKLKNR
jgi:hypothetical protein